ncbi:late competence development protein comfb [Lucifera butyrica]|uniref:Late competence development protein comfb n=1 Tax=Lucifera butyrica TaxID=1351585 RepID=A0A498R9C8_9FIRM|nr:late competence development ComFB family protein [Lucifera butyrica]VBB06872.1 late competence development protein comfb [Lucifera butyrica]
MELKNYMEQMVWNNLDEVLDAYPKACKCEKCRYDIVALALNFLPPRYVVTDKGGTYTRIKALEQQFNVDIITALSNAIKIVNSEPHHEAVQ